MAVAKSVPVVARGYFDPKPDDGLVCPEPTLTVQSSKDECDLNVIIRKYWRTGELPGVKQGVYADISQLGDLAYCLDVVDRAEAAFMDLPADVRRALDDDPVKLVSLAADKSPEATAKLVSLGLVDAPKPATPSSQPASVPVSNTSQPA